MTKKIGLKTLKKMDKYTTLINLITCTGVLMLISVIVLTYAILHAPDFPNDDGESM